jgi:PAS domain S-box-containing protein
MTGSHWPDPERAVSQPAIPAARLRAVLTPAVTVGIVEACLDGLALADEFGTMLLANRRVEEMFGYDRSELLGSPLEQMFSAEGQAGLRQQPGQPDVPGTSPAEPPLRLSGLRRDGTKFPAEVSLTRLATEAGVVTIALIRDVTGTLRHEDPSPTAMDQDLSLDLADLALGRLFGIGLALHEATDLPAGLARQRIEDAALQLDDVIRRIRDLVFTAQTRRTRES